MADPQTKVLLERILLWTALLLPFTTAIYFKTTSARPKAQLVNLVDNHKVFSVSLPATYTNATSEGSQYQRVLPKTWDENAKKADTTAVILNWSRYPNVVALVNIFCDSSLVDIFTKVVIWNNNPKWIHEKDFTCPKGKLKIVNSPQNLYFYARFKACADAETRYCYTQDDDYLVRPEIIRSLHARASDTHPIHLLPAHEHLTSILRTTIGPEIHTSFAWLGHGTIFPRHSAASFLESLKILNASSEEVKMADNYWSVLSNVLPEIWLDQGIELGGGQPFTVGGEGHERNLRHIRRAAEYLDSVLPYNGSSSPKLPYISTQTTTFDRLIIPPKVLYAVCLGSPCVLETNIRLLPEDFPYAASRARDMLALEARGRAALGTAGEAHYLTSPPSAAVDGNISTAFRSITDAKKGDYVALDLLTPLAKTASGADAELVLLVPESTFPIYMVSSLQASIDGVAWTTRHGTWRCVPVGRADALGTAPPEDASDGPSLQECSVRSLDPDAVNARWFRIILTDSVQVKWVLHEVWMRFPSA